MTILDKIYYYKTILTNYYFWINIKKLLKIGLKSKPKTFFFLKKKHRENCLSVY